jgi:hypothetical protein
MDCQDDLSSLITFSTFIFSLNTAALVHLGELPDPLTKEKKVDLVLAKQVIDTLEMLREKTKGNLTPEEEELIKSILFDLKLRFVKLCP